MWLLSPNGITQASLDGRTVNRWSRTMIPVVHAPGRLLLDRSGMYLWVVAGTTAVQLDLLANMAVRTLVALPADTRQVALDSISGVLWVLTREMLLGVRSRRPFHGDDAGTARGRRAHPSHSHRSGFMGLGRRHHRDRGRACPLGGMAFALGCRSNPGAGALAVDAATGVARHAFTQRTTQRGRSTRSAAVRATPCAVDDRYRGAIAVQARSGDRELAVTVGSRRDRDVRGRHQHADGRRQRRRGGHGLLRDRVGAVDLRARRERGRRYAGTTQGVTHCRTYCTGEQCNLRGPGLDRHGGLRSGQRRHDRQSRVLPGRDPARVRFQRALQLHLVRHGGGDVQAHRQGLRQSRRVYDIGDRQCAGQGQRSPRRNGNGAGQQQRFHRTGHHRARGHGLGQRRHHRQGRVLPGLDAACHRHDVPLRAFLGQRCRRHVQHHREGHR